MATKKSSKKNGKKGSSRKSDSKKKKSSQTSGSDDAKKKGGGQSRRAKVRRKKPAARKGRRPKETRESMSERTDLPTASRFDNFADLAQRRAEGYMVVLPRMLRGNERRMHVRQTLREDHRQRIYKSRPDADAKFSKLCSSTYSFFRGTSLLFYRDMAGEDAWMPTVLTLGDVHPENFGVMPSSDNTPIFAVNDFDEAYYAPFTWDLKRGAVGFMVAAEEQGLSKKVRRKIVKHLVRGYLDGIEGFAKDDSERDVQTRIDNAPELIRNLLKDAQRDRENWLAKYLDPKRERFIASEELVPQTSRIGEFQSLVDQYRKDHVTNAPSRAGEFEVKDVAEKKGSGTASLGLPRFYVLLEGPSSDGTDDLILEMKQARRSSLAGLAPPSQYEEDGEADRVVNAQAVHLVGGDPFYGKVSIEGQSFLVRERSPFKREVDLASLSKKEWRTYADICGHSLAQAHALADESGSIKGDVEPRILEAVGNQDLFVDDILRFAQESFDRVHIDHKGFIEDFGLGAFETIDVIYD